MHIISMQDFGEKNPIGVVLAEAIRMIDWARRNTSDKQYPNHKAVLLFLERSTRTMYSTQQALMNLGMRHTIISGADHTSVLKGESFADTIRMFVGQGARIIAPRTRIEGAPLFAAKISQEYITKKSVINPGPVSIVNCGDGQQWHPTQTVLDMLTIKRTLGRLENFTLGIMGDPSKGRTSHSLLQAFAARPEMKFVFVAPRGFEMPKRYKAGLKNVVESDSLAALTDCDIVYVTRFQMERMSDEERRYINSIKHEFIINRETLDSWNPNIRIMHPLPRVDEIAPEVSLDNRIIAFEQAEYGIPARMALLSKLCDGPFIPYELPAEPHTLIKRQEERAIDQQKPIKYFQPVDKGTVVDHIPGGKLEVVFQILKSLGMPVSDGPINFVQGVRSKKYGPKRKKDILLLHNVQLPTEIAAVIQGLFPETTVNYLPGNGRIKKTRFNPPVKVPIQAKCSNKWCITNHDHEAAHSFIFKNQSVVCEYCGTPLWQ